MILGSYRFEKVDPKEALRKNQPVWLHKLRWVYALAGTGPAFGRVVKDSYWPDCWVTVEVTNKEQFADWWNGKEKVKCQQHLR
jgi:hypothetical protein